MYEWRRLTPAQRESVLTARRLQEKPWHSPPRWLDDPSDNGPKQYLITAACYEHAPVLGISCARLSAFTDEVLEVAGSASFEIYAWCVLHNHYHLLLRTDRLRHLTRKLGRLHGRTSRAWNLEDGTPGRKVWYRCSDRRMRSDAHFWTTINYVHNNPVHHRNVTRWLDWPWSSTEQYLRQVGREEALRIWHDYPLLDYGKKWDH